jgi:hypothetical protein
VIQTCVLKTIFLEEEKTSEQDIIVIIQAAKPKLATGAVVNGPIVNQISNE